MSHVSRESLLEQYRTVRQASIAMVKPLKPEDFRIQPIEEVSPPWWNLGHTSWFFARNLIATHGGPYLPDDKTLDYALNSYYVALGPRLERNRRGLITRPTTEEIFRYRELVDTRVETLIRTVSEERLDEFAGMLTLGMHHEQQHQELFYTEIKFILAQNPLPLRPPYRAMPPQPGEEEPEVGGEFLPFAGGLFEFGHLEGGWCWDNELPVHKGYLRDFALQNLLVTNGEYLEFIEDRGYHEPLLWLSNGWSKAQGEGWEAPLYWERHDGEWQIWTLGGMRELDPLEPVCHVSFYEADAFAQWKSQTDSRWTDVRLPIEREWEHAARVSGVTGGHFVDLGRFHPAPACGPTPLQQMLGDVWEWTASYYEPYPGYTPFPGALSEYNEKFMDNQRVLRGGSCVTERSHIRVSYRNFWPPATRFQFTGIRLAKYL
ncbi:MAG TPA: ergothioneine biosynthesis protein EgtB [archaeon]|nr:ergothioneine biosynthesis protein EgtB [archaeon]